MAAYRQKAGSPEFSFRLLLPLILYASKRFQGKHGRCSYKKRRQVPAAPDFTCAAGKIIMRTYIDVSGEQVLDLSGDIKLRMFLNDSDILGEACLKSHDKGIDAGMRSRFFSPEGREAFLDSLVDGTFHISPPVEIYRDKVNDVSLTFSQAEKRGFEEVRKLYKNTDFDRMVLIGIYKVYYRLYEKRIHPCCMSYKKGMSAGKTARLLSKRLLSFQNGHGYKIDISKFFDSVSKDALYRLLDELDTGSLLDELVQAYYHDDRAVVSGMLVPHYKSLAQGCALGCLLADLILYPVDEALSSMDIIYYRYSDDILMIGKDSDKALRKLVEMLSDYGLELNPKKIETIYPHRWFTFLGYSFKDNLVSVSEKKVRSIRVAVKNRTYAITRKRRRPATVSELKSMVHSIMDYLYTAFCRDDGNYGMGPILFSAVNVEQDLREIDTYIKDCLRAAYTDRSEIYGIGYYPASTHVICHSRGKNVRSNRVKTTGEAFIGNDLLRECGYVSLLHMYKAWHCGRALYESEIRRIRNHEFEDAVC